MNVHSRLESWLMKLRRGPREVWANEERTHVQVLEVEGDDLLQYATRLRESVETLPGVSWARFNGALGRLVIAHHEPPEREALLARIEQIEVELEAGPGFAKARPAYAGDVAPERRNWIEIGADVVSFAVSTSRRLSGDERAPYDLNLAALVTAIDGVPGIKGALAHRFSGNIADLAIELSKTASQIATNSETGPVVTVLRHAMRLVEARARERVWTKREVELCSRPEDHPVSPPGRKDRPAPLRRGTVEHYDSAAVPVALGVFATSLWFTSDIVDASPALFAGLPRAGHQARSAFAAHFGWLLARRDVLVLDGEALRRLDRIDVLVLPRSVLERYEAETQRLVRRAREINLRVRVVGEGPALDWLAADEQEPKRAIGKVVRRLQRDGSGVLLIGDRRCDGYAQADLALALSTSEPPWGAHVVARWGMHDAHWIVDAIAAARQTAEQSVALAVLEATTGLVLSFGGLERRTADRNLDLANLAGVLALLNGARLAHGLDREPPPPPKDNTPYHALEVEEVLSAVGGTATGLSEQEAAGRRSPAAAVPSRSRRLARAVWDELANPMTPVVALGAGISASVGSGVDAALLGGAIGINGLVGGLQRRHAERAIEGLGRKEVQHLRVLRDGALARVSASDLVVGDVVELETGDLVVADCRILESVGLEADEATLTGESLPVAKSSGPSPATAVAERSSMLYADTSIAAGSARAVVVAVGDDTEAGRARLAAGRRTLAGGVEARLHSLSSLTVPVAGASALALLASGLLHGRPFEKVIGAAVGLGVAAVPEGLPILATLAQLAAAKRLSRKGVLVKNPRSLEPLGRVDVFCADKTGTLTEGNIRLAVVSDGKRMLPLNELQAGHAEVLAIALRATPERNGQKLAHPTDEALVQGASKVQIGVGEAFERLSELPFEPGRGFHATLGRLDGRIRLSIKGAPEVVLKRCDRRHLKGRTRKLDRARRDRLLSEARELGRRGYRVLAIAEASPEANGGLNSAEIRDLTFRGFVGLSDPVRGTSRAAIDDLRAAGVRTIMITGDHPSTAHAIADELGLAGEVVLTGAEVDDLADDALAERMQHTSVVARVTPAQKVRLVRVLRMRGHTVAMTGDGANDSAAIELADVGIALGRNSTAAARNAADLVVTDGRLETIVEAVLEGRSLWASVRDAVSILVGGNLGEIGFTVLAGLPSGVSPLNARQLLLVNLVTDTLPSLAIAAQPPKKERIGELMGEGPDASLGEQLDAAMLRRALITAGAAGSAYLWARLSGCGPEKASTVGLVTLTGAQLGQTLVIGGKDPTVIGASLTSLAALLAVVELPGISHFFGCRPLGPIALFEASSTCAAATALAAVLDRRARRTFDRAPDDVPAGSKPSARPSEVAGVSVAA